MTCGNTKLSLEQERQLRDEVYAKTFERYTNVVINKEATENLLHDLALWRSKAGSGSTGWGGGKQ